METKIIEIAERIRGLRIIEDLTVEEMASATDVSVEEYAACENGQRDLSFTFLYKCAKKLGIDIVEILTGDHPKLSFYSIVRKDKGLDIKRREGFKYEHVNYLLKNKSAEAFVVTAPYKPEEQDAPIHLSTHKGQELDYVISGQLKVQFEDKVEILNAGDTAYYDSGRGHGMIATGGQECKFLAVVIRENKED